MTLVGNRPEFMPLDTNLFADLKTRVRQHVCMAPEAFNIGNVKNLQSAVKRVWQQMEPERIRQDIMRWPVAVDKVIAAHGGYVPDIDTRHGRRTFHEPQWHPDAIEAREAKTLLFMSMEPAAICAKRINFLSNR